MTHDNFYRILVHLRILESKKFIASKRTQNSAAYEIGSNNSTTTFVTTKTD